MPSLRFRKSNDRTDRDGQDTDTGGQGEGPGVWALTVRTAAPGVMAAGDLPTYDQLLDAVHLPQREGFWAGMRAAFDQRRKAYAEGALVEAYTRRLDAHDAMIERLLKSYQLQHRLMMAENAGTRIQQEAKHQVELEQIRQWNQRQQAISGEEFLPGPPSAPPAEVHVGDDQVQTLAMQLIQECGADAFTGPSGSDRRERLYRELPQVAAQSVERTYLDFALTLRRSAP